MKPTRIPDHWLLRADQEYPSARRRLSASNWQPARYPAAISRPRTAEQVRTDLRTAAESGYVVAVRSGGHSTNRTHLADAAVTLDLGRLRDVAVDTASTTAWVGPGTTALHAARALEASGLSFPLGHSPTVGVGGFLLAGGNGWNTPVWGHACDRILAAEVVLPDGRLATIDAATEPVLFAMLRGAGPAFPGVVTAFQLALVPEQPQIRRLLLTVDGADPERLGQRLDETIHQLPQHVETTVFWHPARAPRTRPTATVAATSFDTDGEADYLAALSSADLPVLSISGSDFGPSLFRLLDSLPRHEGEAIWSHHTWANAGYAQVLPLLPMRAESLLPSSCVLLTTSAVAARPAPSAAKTTSRLPLYRPSGRMTVSAYAHWNPSELPASTAAAWARHVIAALQSWSTGRYVGEADLTATSAQECFGHDGAARLAAARSRIDPNGLLHSPFTLTSPQP